MLFCYILIVLCNLLGSLLFSFFFLLLIGNLACLSVVSFLYLFSLVDFTSLHFNSSLLFFFSLFLSCLLSCLLSVTSLSLSLSFSRSCSFNMLSYIYYTNPMHSLTEHHHHHHHQQPYIHISAYIS
jgi:hypothetical protein